MTCRVPSSVIPQPFNSSPLRITLPPHGTHRSRSLSHALLGIRFRKLTDFVAQCHLQRTHLAPIHLHKDLNHPELVPSDFMLAWSPILLSITQSVSTSTTFLSFLPHLPFLQPVLLFFTHSLLLVPPLLCLSSPSSRSYSSASSPCLSFSSSLPSLLCASFLPHLRFFCETASAWRQSVHRVRMQRLKNKQSRWRHD